MELLRLFNQSLQPRTPGQVPRYGGGTQTGGMLNAYLQQLMVPRQREQLLVPRQAYMPTQLQSLSNLLELARRPPSVGGGDGYGYGGVGDGDGSGFGGPGGAGDSGGFAAGADGEASGPGASDGGGGGGAGPGDGGDGAAAAGDAGSTGGWAEGGLVTNERLVGPNPRGKDDGYGALDAGEFVIRADRAKALGTEKLRALNEGRATIQMRK
jgi:hypothetical protein